MTMREPQQGMAATKTIRRRSQKPQATPNNVPTPYRREQEGALPASTLRRCIGRCTAHTGSELPSSLQGPAEPTP